MLTKSHILSYYCSSISHSSTNLKEDAYALWKKTKTTKDSDT